MSSKSRKYYKGVRTTMLVLLFFLGISALGGATPMLIDPSGEMMGIPPELLAHSPFENFLIPAIILAVFNGILSLLFALMVIKGHRLQAWMVMFQGCVLTIWLIAEVIMGLFSRAFTIPYLIIATALIAGGFLMRLSKTGLS
jgi:hypothetical protein